MRLFTAIVFVCVTLATCFEESEFLSHIRDELEDYLGDDVSRHSFHERFKRDSGDDSEVVSEDQLKCKQTSKKSCCGKNNSFKRFADPDKTLGKACYEEISERLKPEAQQYETQSLFSCHKYKLLRKLQFCVLECVGKKKNVLNTNGTINEAEMKKYLTTDLFKEDWQKALSGKIITKCLNEKYVEWPENEPGVKCNPVVLQFQHCLWKEYETNCPRSEQKDSKKCIRLRNQLKQQGTRKLNSKD